MLDPSWLKPIDIYCERTSASYWAEPFNAISNISMVIAGVLGFWKNSKLKASLRSRWTTLFSLLACGVGLGSYLFHTHANRWSYWADVVPIMIFMGCFLAFTLHRVLSWKILPTISGLLVFAIIGVLLDYYAPPNFLNRSLSYSHALFALIAIGFYLKKLGTPLGKLFLLSGAVFTTSLFFRTIDMKICPHFPIGSHFIWHSINGVLLWLLIQVVIQHRQSDFLFAKK